MQIVNRESPEIAMTKILLSSSQFSSLPSLHSTIPLQGVAMIVISIVPGRRFSTHSIIASFGKVSLHNSNFSSSPFRQCKMPSQAFAKIDFINCLKLKKVRKINGFVSYTGLGHFFGTPVI